MLSAKVVFNLKKINNNNKQNNITLGKKTSKIFIKLLLFEALWKHLAQEIKIAGFWFSDNMKSKPGNDSSQEKNNGLP